MLLHDASVGLIAQAYGILLDELFHMQRNLQWLSLSPTIFDVYIQYFWCLFLTHGHISVCPEWQLQASNLFLLACVQCMVSNDFHNPSNFFIVLSVVGRNDFTCTGKTTRCNLIHSTCWLVRGSDLRRGLCFPSRWLTIACNYYGSSDFLTSIERPILASYGWS